MKITTFNLQGFDNWQQRQPRIHDYLTTLNPEVIFFQEVVFLPEISPFNQVELLNQQLHYPYESSVVSRLQPSPHYETFREGLAILSRYPIKKQGSLVLKKDSRDEHHRIVQWADIETPKGDYLVMNVHFSLTDEVDFATPQLQEIISYCDKREEYPLIGGDFNLSSLESSRPQWEKRYHSTETIPYRTFPEEDKRIDYFLAPREYTFKNLSVSPEGLSDHLALTIEVEKDNIL